MKTMIRRHTVLLRVTTLAAFLLTQMPAVSFGEETGYDPGMDFVKENAGNLARGILLDSNPLGRMISKTYDTVKGAVDKAEQKFFPERYARKQEEARRAQEKLDAQRAQYARERANYEYWARQGRTDAYNRESGGASAGGVRVGSSYSVGGALTTAGITVMVKGMEMYREARSNRTGGGGEYQPLNYAERSNVDTCLSNVGDYVNMGGREDIDVSSYGGAIPSDDGSSSSAHIPTTADIQNEELRRQQQQQQAAATLQLVGAVAGAIAASGKQKSSGGDSCGHH